MTTHVIGAGQAGLSVSHELLRRGIEHVVLEADVVASTWRRHWDSFTLVTPNWTLNLNDAPYDGDDPEGHVPRDEIVAYLERYAATRAGEIRSGVRVNRLEATTQGGFRLTTNRGDIDADSVVVCTGAFERPHRPQYIGAFPTDVDVIDVDGYRNPSRLRPGGVLVVGSGQSGVQIAEEVHLSGRRTALACGRAPWLPRRLDGRDIVTLMIETGFFDELPPPGANRWTPNAQTSGGGGGHDVHYRTLRAMGVTLTGRLLGVENGRINFADDLLESVAFGDARYREMAVRLREHFGDALSPLPEPEPFGDGGPRTLTAADFGTVVFATGFRPTYRDWIKAEVFDTEGMPVVAPDLSTAIQGLFFCGVHMLRARRSSGLYGVGQDAAIVADTLAAQLRTA